jgi:type I restriction enzyme S subunit
MSFDVVKLGEVSDLVSGYAFSSDEFIKTGIPVVKLGNISDGRVTLDDSVCFGGDHSTLPEKVFVHENDILIAMTGGGASNLATAAGRVGLYRNKQRAVLNQRVGKLIPRTIDVNFLYYALLQSSVTTELANSSNGSAQSNLTSAHILNLTIPYPTNLEQRSIAKILGDLDRKIELNRRMNETLEQIGQALFKHHFVDNPENEKLCIGDVAQVIDCLHSQKPEQLSEDTGYILLQLNNILDKGVLDITNKYYISEDDYRHWTARIEVKENDFIITNVGRSGAVAKIPQSVQAAIGRNMTAIRLNNDFNYPGYISFVLTSQWMQTQIESKLDHGTILSALNVKTIPKLEVPGSLKLMNQFEENFLSLRQKIEKNHAESTLLSEIRDSILPKLMSGQITV